jgi:transcriptional regulator with XRE-family HTH domain
MNETNPLDSLEVVLDRFLESTSVDDPGQLKEWIRRYPQYGRELTELALSRLEMELHDADEEGHTEDPGLIERGMEIMRRKMQREETAAAAMPLPIRDLLDEAAAHGLTARDLARDLRVTVAMVTRLSRRLIRFASIPHQLLEELGQLLKRDVASITAYLQLPPTLAAGAQYKSEKPPEVGQAVDFYDALEADTGLPVEYRRYWVERRQATE